MTRAKKTHVNLQLFGSQMNLSHRPISYSHIITSTREQMTIRRSVSATPTVGHRRGSDSSVRNINRPLSADNYYRRTYDNFQNQSISFVCDSNWNSNNTLDGENLEENQNELKPGLLSKPPLPPPTSVNFEKGQENKIPEEDCEDLIALKFKKWFPNSSNDVFDHQEEPDYISYKEQTLRTTEFRYKVSNTKKEPDTKGNKYKVAETPKKKLPVKKVKQPEIKKTKKIINPSKDKIQNSSKNDKMSHSVKFDDYHENGKVNKILQKKNEENSTESLKTISKPGRTVDQCQEKVDKFKPTRVESPQQPAGTQTEDVLTWMEAYMPKTESKPEKITKSSNGRKNSMYDEIVDILKAIEDDDKNSTLQSPQDTLTYGDKQHSASNVLLSFLDENENQDTTVQDVKIDKIRRSSTPAPLEKPLGTKKVNECSSNCSSPDKNNGGWNRLSDLLILNPSELAQKVIALQLQLEEREQMIQSVNNRCQKLEDCLQNRKQKNEAIIAEQNRLLDQMTREKKSKVQNLEKKIEEMEKKHSTAMKIAEENYKLELKKVQEKQAAADKIQREKWLETKTQKLKELAFKGLEPELNKMANIHQEELSHMKRFHQRQIQEMEETYARKIAVIKEKAEAEKEKALSLEREMSRQRLDDEVMELEKRYQEQRKRLLTEVHLERENLEREIDATLSVKEKELERKFEKRTFEISRKIEDAEEKHQEDLKQLRHQLELEKQSWIKNEMIKLEEKELKMKEECKKQRDRNIQEIIEKLENETAEKEEAFNEKLKKLKEHYNMEVTSLETTLQETKNRLNDAREELKKADDVISNLNSNLHKSKTELAFLKDKLEQSVKEKEEIQSMTKGEISTKISILKSELNQTQLTYEAQIKAIKNDNEREMSQVYNRIREIIAKKDEKIYTLNEEKKAALNQCSQLENILEQWRKDHYQRN